MRRNGLIISYKEIKKNLPVFQNKKTVLVGGCFDLIHFGHLKFLKEAALRGDYLIVALESDEFIKKKKRKIPIHNQRQRAEILTSLNMVDMVIILPLFESYEDYFSLVKQINPNIVAISENDPQKKNKKKQVEEVGGELKIVTKNLDEFSTKKIYETIFSS